MNSIRTIGALAATALLALAGIADLQAGTIGYTYDTAGRLIRATYANGTVIEYVYDAAGNPVSRESQLAGPGYSSTPAPGAIIDLGTVALGASATATLTVRETGDAALMVSAVAITGSEAGDFSATPTGFTIADGGADHAITVTCTPRALGARTATLSITHNAPVSPATYGLQCTGQTAAKQSQTISFAALPDKRWGDPPFTVSATASSGLPVNFSAAGDCTVAGATVTLTAAGTCTITARQDGNDAYYPAPDVAHTFRILIGTRTTLTGLSPNPSHVDQAVTASYAVSPLAPPGETPTGQVRVTASTGESCVASVAAGACQISFPTAGERQVAATYEGDARFAGSVSASQTQQVQGDLPPPLPIPALGIGGLLLLGLALIALALRQDARKGRP